MKKEKFLVISFLIIIYAVFLFFPIKHILVKFDVLDFQIMDNWIFYEYSNSNKILDKINDFINSKKIALENRTTNYFPFYISLNELYQDFNYKTNSILYNEVPLKTNGEGEYIFFDKLNNFYYLETSLNHSDLDNRVENQINFFNKLGNDLDLYIYIPTRIELTDLKKNNLSKYVNYFLNGLNDNIHVDVTNYEDIFDYKNRFYLTDHHWNMYGAIEGYKDIMSMFDIHDDSNFEINVYDEQKYYGSLAKTSVSDLSFDYISDINLNLDYDVLVNGEDVPLDFKPREIKNGKAKYYDYYVSYFNSQYGNIVYDYHQTKKDNLLILSDSFIWSIDYLIASNFNKTHVINLRYDEYKNSDFKIYDYIKENDISKVLFIYEGGSIIFDQYNYNFVGRIK